MTGKPKLLIETRWEKRKGFKFLQPTKYCGETELTFDVISNFKEIFGEEYSKVSKDSFCYENTLNDINYNSDLWKNNVAKQQAFDKVYEFNKSGKSGTGSSTTPLLPFEIFLLNDGFEMVSFSEMNAINPGVSLVYNKDINNIGLKYSRCYKKDDYFIILAFGIEINKKKTNFYFMTNKHPYAEFQVDNNLDNFDDAINGKLRPL